MKKFILLGFLILSISMLGQERVGENRNGTFVITANLNLLKLRWNEIMGETVKNYSIISATSEGELFYYLVANTDNGNRVATTLAYRNNIFSVPDQSLESSSTCSCDGCRWNGCDPRWLSGHGNGFVMIHV